MQEYVRIGTDLFIGFFALLLITKALGKTQITQITPFDFISALVLGELVGNAVYDKEIGIGQIVFAVFLWGVLIYIIEVITQKFRKTRSFLEGKPSIVIHKGRINRGALKKSKLDIDQLMHLLRTKGVFAIRDAEYAILETDGSLSVLKKPQVDTPTRSDLSLQVSPISLSIILISDGEVIWENLRECGFDEAWLKSNILEYGVDKYEDILIAEWTEEDGFFAQKY